MLYFMAMIVFAAGLFAQIPEKVILCGICRDVAQRLPHTIKIMEEIGSLFEDYRVVVYENNSVDQTKTILDAWACANRNVLLFSENCQFQDLDKTIINCSRDHHFFRPEEIARARNIVLDQAMTDKYADFPYLIWMDMDFVIPPAIEGIVEVFQADREWDAVFAYGITRSAEYWDWYALRDAVFPIGSELLGNDWWYMPKHLQLHAASNWYPVYSAFGGCGIYKKSSIANCRYSAVVTRDLETVAREIIEQGRMASHPQVLNYLAQINRLRQCITIPCPAPHLPQLTKGKTGIILYPDLPSPLTWRMSSSVYQYPSVCEHVTFHASMIVNGHGKLFINPRMIFYYGG